MKSCILKIAYFAIGLACLGGVSLIAQDDTLGTAAVSQPSADTDIWDLISKGGLAMIPLGILSMAGTGLIVYNLMAVREKAFLSSRRVEELEPFIDRLDIDGAKEICKDSSSPAINIILAGLNRIIDGELDQTAIEKAVDDAAEEELSGAFVLINYLSVIGAIAPMVGLLGTVSGMVKAFRSISTIGMGDPSVLANNISEALITTASGLIVAIPALLAYYYFKNKFGKISSSVNRVVGDVFFRLSRAARSARL
ncbi:MAG: MotA/TolQ/ExbB proton channel family protein [Verrucomicrobiota bacterium]